MSRITVEDCLENVDNRFGLVLIAARRARLLALGSEPLLDWENDKPTLVALREIAANKVGAEVLDQPIVDYGDNATPLPAVEGVDLDSADFEGPDPDDDEEELADPDNASDEAAASEGDAEADSKGDAEDNNTETGDTNT